MNPKKYIIYLVRHGQVDSGGLYYGPDVPLNVKGILQAKLLGKFLNKSNVTFDQILSSDMGRAKQTSEIVLSQLSTPEKLTITLEPRIREWNGREWIGKSYDHMKDFIGQGVSDDYPYKKFAIPGAESPQEMLDRLKPFFNKLLNCPPELNPNHEKKILIISHGFFIRLWMRHLKVCEEFELVNYDDSLWDKGLENTGFHRFLINLTGQGSTKSTIEFVDKHFSQHLEEL